VFFSEPVLILEFVFGPVEFKVVGEGESFGLVLVAGGFLVVDL
jgi:hypothetical protein